MGEYARRRSDGQQVKVGTCEDMYYLRFRQVWDVAGEPGSVNPAAVADRLRFRFPWPDEDHMRAGDIGDWDYHRAVPIRGLSPTEGVEHRSVQFTAPGYLASFPCPESGQFPGRFHRNGFPGGVQLVAHRYRPELGRLVPVLKCGGCGAMWREEDPAKIAEIEAALRAQADHEARTTGDVAGQHSAAFWSTIADRLAPFVKAGSLDILPAAPVEAAQ